MVQFAFPTGISKQSVSLRVLPSKKSHTLRKTARKIKKCVWKVASWYYEAIYLVPGEHVRIVVAELLLLA